MGFRTTISCWNSPTRADQPTFIGLTNTLIAPFTFVGPILGGWIAAAFNIDVLFIVIAGFWHYRRGIVNVVGAGAA